MPSDDELGSSFAGDITEDDDIVVAGVLSNPCDEDIEYISMSTCLIAGLSWDGPVSGGASVPCGDAITPFVVPAMGSVWDATNIGSKPAGDYTVTMSFDGSSPVVTTSFTVVETMASAMVPDFTLPDENPRSPSFGESISPRDLIGKVTGWYFIKAT